MHQFTRHHILLNTTLISRAECSTGSDTVTSPTVYRLAGWMTRPVSGNSKRPLTVILIEIKFVTVSIFSTIACHTSIYLTFLKNFKICSRFELQAFRQDQEGQELNWTRAILGYISGINLLGKNISSIREMLKLQQSFVRSQVQK